MLTINIYNETLLLKMQSTNPRQTVLQVTEPLIQQQPHLFHYQKPDSDAALQCAVKKLFSLTAIQYY